MAGGGRIAREPRPQLQGCGGVAGKVLLKVTESRSRVRSRRGMGERLARFSRRLQRTGAAPAAAGVYDEVQLGVTQGQNRARSCRGLGEWLTG